MGTVEGLRLQAPPAWMAGYCHKAANDLGYPVLCPQALPPLVDIVPCRGPAPAEVLWGRYCVDYVLDALFRGPPGYQGPFGNSVGHLALWTVSTSSDFWHGGFFGCPGGGQRRKPERIDEHEGYWWSCPATSGGANLNSGHIGFQWLVGNLVSGMSVHGLTEVNQQMVRELLGRVEEVRPAS